MKTNKAYNKLRNERRIGERCTEKPFNLNRAILSSKSNLNSNIKTEVKDGRK